MGLTTDGASNDDPADLWKLLANTTNLMGIYVGNSDRDAKQLQDVVCYKEPPTPSPCKYFVAAANFQQLVARAREVASSIASETDRSVTHITHDFPCDAPLEVLWALLLLLPAVLWWLYLHLRCPRKPAPAPFVHRDPDRILLAGA